MFWKGLSDTDETVKKHYSGGIVKSFRCKARKSDGMTEDAAQRRRWRAPENYPPPIGGTFYEAVNTAYKI